MNLHKIHIKMSHVYLWLDVESRTTWRATGAHIWQVNLEYNFPTIDDWNNNGRPPAAICGYRPRQGTMHVRRYNYVNRCIHCRQTERERDILVMNYNRANDLATR